MKKRTVYINPHGVMSKLNEEDGRCILEFHEYRGDQQLNVRISLKPERIVQIAAHAKAFLINERKRIAAAADALRDAGS